LAKSRQPYTEREQNLILTFYEMGTTDKMIADALKEPYTTFKDRCGYTIFYKNVLNEKGKIAMLSDIIKKVKNIADLQVEASLYIQAKKGKLGAICVWLFNRMPEKWKTVQHIKIVKEVKEVVAEMTEKETNELFSELVKK